MINIQNADNVHIGHNYTNESTLPKSVLPEHTIEKNESLESNQIHICYLMAEITLQLNIRTVNQ